MTKEEYLALASEKYDELQALNKIDNFSLLSELFLKQPIKYAESIDFT